jgi:hypothetical protein
VVAGSLVALMSAVVVLVPSLINKVATDNLRLEQLQSPEQVGQDFSRAINVLLIGDDERTNELGGFGADSVTIVHVDAAHTQVFVVSVSRDSMVAIPAFRASKFPGQRRFHRVSSRGADRADLMRQRADNPSGSVRLAVMAEGGADSVPEGAAK